MSTQTTDYEQQAQAFLDRFGIRFRTTLSDSKVAPWGDEVAGERHHYRVCLSKDSMPLIGRKSGRIVFDYWGSIADCADGKHPTAYDVLSCISGDVHCADTFKDFCAEFGESEDSIKALQTWRRCAAFSKRLRLFFTSEEIEALGEIQ